MYIGNIPILQFFFKLSDLPVVLVVLCSDNFAYVNCINNFYLCNVNAIVLVEYTSIIWTLPQGNNQNALITIFHKINDFFISFTQCNIEAKISCKNINIDIVWGKTIFLLSVLSVINRSLQINGIITKILMSSPNDKPAMWFKIKMVLLYTKFDIPC